MNNLISKFKSLVNTEAVVEQSSRLKVLFRPARWNYIKKMQADTECPFCKASRLEMSFETLTVYKSDHSMIVLNKFPYNTGHILVIPKRHEGDFLNLTQSEYEDLHYTLRIAVEAVKKTYEAHGMNVGLNLDKAAGAGLPDHLHYHVVPRFRGDLNFFPMIAETKVVPEMLDVTYEKLKNYFKR